MTTCHIMMKKNMSGEEDSYIRHSWSEPESEPGSYGSIDSDNYSGYNIPVNYPPVEYDLPIHYAIGEGRNEDEIGKQLLISDQRLGNV